MRVAIMGTGYVGLVTGTCLSELGHVVTCIDKNDLRVAQLRRGECPIHEPGLEELIAKNARAGRLSFTGDANAPVAEADVVFIAVGTPQMETTGQANLSYVREAARSIARAVSGFTVVAVKSTVPPGTCDELQALFDDAGCDVAVASNPEFLREGAAIGDFMQPDRIVVGTEDPRARQRMQDLYATLASAAPLLVTRRRNSELIKYASNAFLATKIAFVNELAGLCEAADGDIGEITAGMGLDPRIGDRFLAAGPGYGGSCFPKDTAALAAYARDRGAPLKLVEATIRANDGRKKAVAQRIVRALGGEISGKRIAILGLTFKANTDDMRDAPSLTIIPALQHEGAEIMAYDPEGMAAARGMLSCVTYCSNPYLAAEQADAVVVLTEWPQFRALEFARLAGMMRGRVIVDCRNMLDAETLETQGFTLIGIGTRLPDTGEGTTHEESIVPFKAHSRDRRSGLSGITPYRQAGAARAPGHRRG